MGENARQLQLTREWRLLRALEGASAGLSYVELAKALGTGVRTVYRDLATLKAAGFPIGRARAGLKSVWRIAKPVSLGVVFTPQELTALTFARNLVLSLHGSPFQGAMRQAFMKISAACDRDGLKVIDMVDKRVHAECRRMRPYTQKQVWFRMLVDAVIKQCTVRIRYFTKERAEESVREVDPYGMVLHEGAFYLVGFCHRRREVRTFLLDRISAVAGTGGTFPMPADFSVKDHFKQAWGLLKGAALVRVRIRFCREAAHVIREGRWHGTQRIENLPDGSVVLSVEVTGWEEIMRWVMSFGAQAEVLEPADLRKSVAAESAAMAAAHRRKVKGARGDSAGN